MAVVPAVSAGRDLVDARDDSGNTALIYAAAKAHPQTRQKRNSSAVFAQGFRQCTAALLRAGADPELPNQGNGDSALSQVQPPGRVHVVARGGVL